MQLLDRVLRFCERRTPGAIVVVVIATGDRLDLGLTLASGADVLVREEDLDGVLGPAVRAAAAGQSSAPAGLLRLMVESERTMEGATYRFSTPPRDAPGTRSTPSAGELAYQRAFGNQPPGFCPPGAQNCINLPMELHNQALGGPDHNDRTGINPAWRDYLTQSIRVRTLAADPGGFQAAVALTLGDGARDFTLFDTTADGALAGSQRLFAARLSSAGHGFGGLAIGVSAAASVAAALVLAGLQIRINEYR